MNILHINCNYVGTALHRNMIEHLDTEDVQSVVFVPISKQTFNKKFEPRDNEIVSFCFKKIDRILYFYKQKKIQKALVREFNNIEDFDYIHAYTLMTDGNTAFRIGKKYSIPFFVAIRDTDVNDFFRLKPYLRPLGVKIMRHAKAVFFLSTPYKERVLNHYVPEKLKNEISKKSYVITNGIDDFWLDNKNLTRDYDAIEERIRQKSINIVCVGRINRRKNVPSVQKAIHFLISKGWNVHLDVIGKVEDKTELDLIIQDENTTYHPPMDKEALIKYYRQDDIFVLPSHKETFGLVYAEAMSQSLPVIYTRGQGFDGQFQQGEVGYAVDDMRPEEIAEAIIHICNDYRTISNRALMRADQYKWDTICDVYRGLYRGLDNE